MKIVLDSNILFSALISGKELYVDIFRSLECYVPDFIFTELSKYQEEIIKKTKLEGEFISFAKELFSEITAIPGLAVSQESYGKALVLCNETDKLSNDNKMLKNKSSEEPISAYFLSRPEH